jgi:ferritin-like metal-binding protein YciE
MPPRRRNPFAGGSLAGEREHAMQITTFKDMYIAELQELRNLEAQLADALLRMAEAASHASLKNLLASHRQKTLAQEKRLESILARHKAKAREHTDQAMQALISETEKMQTIVKDPPLRDAALIASAQKIAHYEIAAYGTGAALAGQLDFRDDQVLLHESMEEAKEIDFRLTRLAKKEVNQDALAA